MAVIEKLGLSSFMFVPQTLRNRYRHQLFLLSKSNSGHDSPNNENILSPVMGFDRTAVLSR